MLLDHCLYCLSVTLAYCGQMDGWMKMKLGTVVGLGPGHIVLDRTGPYSPKTGHNTPTLFPLFWPMSIVAKQLDESRCHLVRR